MFVRMGACLGIAAVPCMLAGWGFTMLGVDELHVALHASARPVEVACAQLRTYRPGSNVHITLTKFVPYRKGIVIAELKEIHSLSVWVPVLPADAPKADPRYIVAVVQLSGISDEESLRRTLAQPRWTGFLHARGDLEPYARHISQSNPGINLASCWVMWEGHKLPELASAIFKVIVCPCVFVLGMVLGVLAALRPITAPNEVPAPTPGLQFWAVDALSDAVRWLYRRGFFSGRTAVFLAFAGVAAVGGAVYVWYRDWDKVVNPHNEALLLFAIIGGLFGLGFLVYAVLLGIASWWTVPAPALSPYQRIHGADFQADPRKMAGPLIVVGFFVLAIAVSELRRGSVSLWNYVFAVLGGLALAGGAIWSLYLSRKSRQEPAHFWNEPGS